MHIQRKYSLAHLQDFGWYKNTQVIPEKVGIKSLYVLENAMYLSHITVANTEWCMI